MAAWESNSEGWKILRLSSGVTLHVERLEAGWRIDCRALGIWHEAIADLEFAKAEAVRIARERLLEVEAALDALHPPSAVARPWASEAPLRHYRYALGGRPHSLWEAERLAILAKITFEDGRWLGFVFRNHVPAGTCQGASLTEVKRLCEDLLRAQGCVVLSPSDAAVLPPG
jgi:hypothetical protein